MGRKAFPGKLRRETKPSQAAVIRPRPQQEKQPCRTDSGMSPPRFSCTGNGTEEAASPTPCLEGAAAKTAHFRKKTYESLNIRRSETTCGHPRIINPPSTKFFEKK